MPGFFDLAKLICQYRIVSYGYSPILLNPAELQGIHGNNERIPIAGMEKGAVILTELLREFATE